MKNKKLDKSDKNDKSDKIDSKSLKNTINSSLKTLKLPENFIDDHLNNYESSDDSDDDYELYEEKKLPWVEKYRPQKLDDVYCHENIILTLKNFIGNNQLPHLLFHGPSGTGKTSVILSCAREFYGDNYPYYVLEINASEERGIEVVRNKIMEFVSTKNLSFSDKPLFKLIILDEADAITADAQAILRRVIEKYTNNARFCLICNYIRKISTALQSRCINFRFTPIFDNYIEKKILEIADKEDFSIDKKAITTIIKKSNGDLRKTINTLQSCKMLSNSKKIDEELIYKCLGFPNKNYMEKIYITLKNDSFNQSFEIINKIKNKEGYSLLDIITEVYELIMEDKKYMVKNTDKIIHLARLQHNLSNTTSDDIQLNYLISIFKL